MDLASITCVIEHMKMWEIVAVLNENAEETKEKSKLNAKKDKMANLIACTMQNQLNLEI